MECLDTTKAARRYGVAIDLGTTTIVSSLLDLATGREMHISARLNPQSSYGLDVMSRVNYASRDGEPKITTFAYRMSGRNYLGMLC